MSGLEGLAALGLLCNILQLVDLSSKAFTVAKNILDSGSPDPSLTRVATELSSISDEVNTSLQSCPRKLDSNETELQKLAADCLAVSTDLNTELSKLAGDVLTGKLQRAVVGSIKAMRRRGRIEKLERTVSRYQNALDTRILVRMSKQQELMCIQNQAEFNDIDRTLRNFIQRLGQGHTTVANLISTESESTKDHVTSQSNKTRHDLAMRLTDIESQRSSKEEIERFSSSLRYETMNERWNQVQDTHKNTFDWIFRSGRGKAEHQLKPEWDDFTDWLGCPDDKVFWIKGKPGSGKSTLMKFILNDSRLHASADPALPQPLVLSHFLWNTGQPIQRSFKGCISSLLYQLISGSPTLYDELKGFSPQLPQKRALSDWSDKELVGTLLSACSLHPSGLYIFLDGLDEIASGEILQLLQFIQKITTVSNIKLCVSSRPEPILAHSLGQYRQLCIQNLTHRDISRYCRDHLGPLFEDEYQLSRILLSLCRTADGVFLWVVLVVDSIKRGVFNLDDSEDIEERLRKLPSDLFSLYNDMWARLNDDRDLYRRQAATYLNLVLTWIETLDEGNMSVSHIILAGDLPLAGRFAAWTQQPADDEIIQQRKRQTMHRLEVQCAGLITVGPRNDAKPRESYRINLVHRSAIEFLRGTPDGDEILSHDPISRSDHQYKLCMAYAGNHARMAVMAIESEGIDYAFMIMGHWVSDMVTTFSRLKFLSTTQLYEIARQVNQAYTKMYTKMWNKCIDTARSGGPGPKTRLYHIRDFNGVVAASGGIECLELLLNSNAEVGPLAPGYFLYILDCFSNEGRTIPVRWKSMVRLVNLLLDRGVGLRRQHVRQLKTMPSHGVKSSGRFSLSRSASTMILQMALKSGPAEEASLLRDLIEDGFNHHEKVLLVLGKADDRTIIWTANLDSTLSFCIGSPGSEGSLVLVTEVELASALRLCARGLFQPEGGQLNAVEFFSTWNGLAPFTKPRLIAFGEWKRTKMEWFRAKDEGRIVDSILDETQDGMFEVVNHRFRCQLGGTFPALTTCVQDEIREALFPLSEQVFWDELVSRGHLVRRRDSLWPPFPPDPYTGEAMEMDPSKPIR